MKLVAGENVVQMPELSDLRAKLPPEIAREWEHWVLEHTSIASGTKSDLGRAIAKEIGVKEGSVRQPLTNFLNGYTHEVYRWLAESPTSKALALCDLMTPTQTPSDLWEEFLARMPNDGAALNSSILDHLDPVFETENWSRVMKPATDWAKDNFGEDSEGWEEGHGRFSWTDLRAVLERLLVRPEVATPIVRLEPELPRSFRFDRRRRLLSEVSHRWTRKLKDDELFGGGDEDDRPEIFLPLPVATLNHEDFEAWLAALFQRGVFTPNQLKSSKEAIGAIPVDIINNLPHEHLIYLLEDAQSPLELGPRVLNRKRTQWTRRELREIAVGEAAQWLSETESFFLRWIRLAGTLNAYVSRDELDRILQVASSRTDTVAHEELLTGIENALRSTPENLAQTKSDLRKLLPDRLKLSLEESNFVRTGASNCLAPRLLELGELELVTALTSSDLKFVSVRANLVLISEAVRLAPANDVLGWCEASLSVQAVDQPDAILAVLEGLAAREDDGTNAGSVIRLWASALWMAIHQVNGGYRRYSQAQTILAFVSERMKSVLPIIGQVADPIDELASMVDERIRHLVTVLERTDPEESRIEILIRNAPFQVPLRFGADQRGRDSVRSSSNWPELHLARSGDLAAKRMLLERRNWNEQIQSVALATRIEWWLELADDVHTAHAWSDLHEAFEVAIQGPLSTRLAKLVGQAMCDEALNQCLRRTLRDPFDRIKAGAEPVVCWVLGIGGEFPSRADEPDRANLLLTIAELTGSDSLLESLSSVQLSEFSDRVQRELCEPGFMPKFDRWEIEFSRLEKLAELRSGALQALARMGKPIPLRNSLGERWAVRSPIVGHHRRLVRELLRAADPFQSSTRTPISDDLWNRLIEVLAGMPRSEIREILERQSVLASADAKISPFYKFLMMFDASPANRRSLLFREVPHIWRGRHAEGLQDFWQSLMNESDDSEDSHQVWHESHELLDSRKRWAEENDEATARKWCRDEFEARRILDDLEGFGEWVWPILEPEQKVRVLEWLPEGRLANHWWSRGQDLPLTERMAFARKHGTLSDRRIIAQHILDSAPAAPRKRITTWLYVLQSRERPPFDEISTDVELFWAEVQESELRAADVHIADSILTHAGDRDQLVRWFPDIVATFIGVRLREHGIDALNEPGWEIANSVRAKKSILGRLSEKQVGDLIAKLLARRSRIYAGAADHLQEDPNFDLRLAELVEDVIQRIESLARSNETPSRLKQLADLKNGRFPNPQRVANLFADLEAPAHNELLSDVIGRPDLVGEPGTGCVVLLELDKSDFSKSKREDHARAVLDVMLTGTDVPERKRDVVVELFFADAELRRPELRAMVRSRLESLIQVPSY